VRLKKSGAVYSGGNGMGPGERTVVSRQKKRPESAKILARRIKANEITTGPAKGSSYFLLTAFFNCIPAENFGTFLAGILMAAPV
jgi:hypothetical protein